MKVNLLVSLDITQSPPIATNAIITTSTPATMMEFKIGDKVIPRKTFNKDKNGQTPLYELYKNNPLTIEDIEIINDIQLLKFEKKPKIWNGKFAGLEAGRFELYENPGNYLKWEHGWLL